MTTTNANSTLRCTNLDCSSVFPPAEFIYHCSHCGEALEVSYKLDSIHADKLKSKFVQRRGSLAVADRSGVWRFRELIPFAPDGADLVSLNEGNTPILDAPYSAKYAGMKQLYLKHLGLNPTGSFKDYGMAAAITQAKIAGAKWVTCASTGNTAASMAAYAARAGLRSLVIVPANRITVAKLSQSLEYGAFTIELESNFDEILRMLYAVARQKHLYLVNSINPYRIEGQKAISFEVLEYFDWDAPDWIVMPGGNLGNTAAAGKALKELRELGFIDRLPRLAIIQAEKANPFYRIWKRKVRARLYPVKPKSFASALNIGNPVSWKKALQALELTNGVCEQVKENEIANAKAIVGRDGIGCEPASAASLAGIKKLVADGTIARDARVVGILTGHLLKDPEYTIIYHSNPEATGVTGKAQAFLREGIKPQFSNYPVRSYAQKDTILKTLEDVLEE